MAWVTIQAKVLEKMNISILRACFATRKDQSAFLYLMTILYSAGWASHVLIDALVPLEDALLYDILPH